MSSLLQTYEVQGFENLRRKESIKRWPTSGSDSKVSLTSHDSIANDHRVLMLVIRGQSGRIPEEEVSILCSKNAHY